MQTYTGPSGTSQPAVNLDQFNTALQSIQGSIPQPQAVQQDLQNVKQGYNVNTDADLMSKIVDLYQHHADVPNQFQAPIDQTSNMPARMTQENVGQPFNGLVDPLLAARANATQVGGAASTVKNIGDIINKNFGAMQSELGNRADIYKARLDASQKATSDVLGLYDWLLKTGMTQKDLANLDLQGLQYGAKYNPQTGQFEASDVNGNPLNQGMDTGISDPATNKKTKLALLDKAIQNAPSIAMAQKYQTLRDNLAKQGQLGSTDNENLSNTISTLDIVNNALKVLQNDKQLRSLASNPITGSIANNMLKINPEVVQKMFNLSPDSMTALSQLIQLQGQGDRSLIGGKLTGYLLDVFRPSFPGLLQNPDTSVQLLKTMKARLETQIKGLGDNNNMVRTQDLPGVEDYVKRDTSGLNLLQDKNNQANKSSGSGQWEIVK